MEKDWTVVYRAGDEYQANILKGMLEENGIESVIINQKDSVYLIGDTLLYVRKDNYDKARQLVLDTEENSQA
jgi:hypothetical protein